MKSYRKELWFNVPTRRAFINITPDVQKCIDESGVKEGLVLVNAMHITASVFINDDESGLHHDYDVWLEKLAPHAPVDQYRHNIGEDNADAHMKRQIMGREVVVAVTNGKLDFGPWETIFYYELDGLRSTAEFREWADKAGSTAGLSKWLDELLGSGRITEAFELVSAGQSGMDALLELFNIRRTFFFILQGFINSPYLCIMLFS